jgi:predicted oxidoreductase (fatty acid repression mutant protein)
MSAAPFLEALANRRSIYPLKKESTISHARIQEIIETVIKHVPSSFNSQSTRIVLLLKGEHEKLWDITSDILKAIVPADQWEKTEQKLTMFKGAYGTVCLPLSNFVSYL